MRRVSAVRQLPTNHAGFTLLEVLIASLILAIGLLAMAMLQIHSIESGAFGQKATQAAMIAEHERNELASLSYDDRESAEEPVTIDANGEQYQLSWTITPTPSGTGVNAVNLQLIQVQVSWTDELMNGKTRTFTLSTLMN